LISFASRLSVANLSIAQKQIAPTTTTIKIPIKTEIIMATSLCCRFSFRLRLQPEGYKAANSVCARKRFVG
jgi:hypothetical protein